VGPVPALVSEPPGLLIEMRPHTLICDGWTPVAVDAPRLDSPYSCCAACRAAERMPRPPLSSSHGHEGSRPSRRQNTRLSSHACTPARLRLALPRVAIRGRSLSFATRATLAPPETPNGLVRVHRTSPCRLLPRPHRRFAGATAPVAATHRYRRALSSVPTHPRLRPLHTPT
jgi:hypothetical protein